MALNHATSPVGDLSVFKRIKKFYAELRREFVTKSTSGGCGQFETSPEAIEPQLLKLFCERRQTDRLKTNYRIDAAHSIHSETREEMNRKTEYQLERFV